MTSGPYSESAPGYWKRGWRGILPLPVRAKKSPPTGCTGENGRDPSFADIYAWCEGEEGAGNIALRLPRNVLGIDIDAYGDKLGKITLHDAEHDYGELPSTWRTTSRDDGLSGIALFRVPEGLKWPGEIGPGVELIQWGHRYAVVAPSIHPDTGATYRWINPHGVVSTIVPDPDELPVLPESWVAHYTGGELAVATMRNDYDRNAVALWISSRPGASEPACSRMTRGVEQMRKDLAGSAHSAARDGALRALRLADEGHPGVLDVLSRIWLLFDAEVTSPNRTISGKRRRSDREAEREWSDLLTSAMNLVTANPSGAITCDCSGQITMTILGGNAAGNAQELPSRVPSAPESPSAPVLDRRLSDAASFVLDAPVGVPAIWGHGDEVLWAEGEALMLVGPPGVGKTTVTGQLLRGLLYGSELLGLPVRCSARRVLYLAMDRPAQIARALRRSFDESDRVMLAERCYVWRGPPPGDVAVNPEILVQLAALADADVVILDSLKDAALGLSTDEVGAGYNRARQTALAAGIQVLELHHLVKRGPQGAKPTQLADVYGSGWLTAGAGSVVLLWGQGGDLVVELSHLKQPAAEVGPFLVLHDHVRGTTTIQHGTDVLMLVAEAGSTGITAKALAQVVAEKSNPTPNEVEKARRSLERLVEQGHLSRERGSRGGGAERTSSVYRAFTGNHAPRSASKHANHGAKHADFSSNHVSDEPAGQAITAPITPFTAAIPITPSPLGEGSGYPQDEISLDVRPCSRCEVRATAAYLDQHDGLCPSCALRDRP